jgi:hypothetical protein
MYSLVGWQACCIFNGGALHGLLGSFSLQSARYRVSRIRCFIHCTWYKIFYIFSFFETGCLFVIVEIYVAVVRSWHEYNFGHCLLSEVVCSTALLRRLLLGLHRKLLWFLCVRNNKYDNYWSRELLTLGWSTQECSTCDLPKQNRGLKLKYKQKKLKCLHLLDIYFGYLVSSSVYLSSKARRNISVLFSTNCPFFQFLFLFSSHNIKVFVNNAKKFKCIAKRISYAKADPCHLIAMPKG